MTKIIRRENEGLSLTVERGNDLLSKYAEEGQAITTAKAVAGISGDIAVRLAIALDYTASTINDVRGFRENTGKIVRQVGEGNKIFVLPAVFKGDNTFMTASERADIGPVDNLSWFASQKNITNGREEPPITAALREIMRTGFFLPAEKADKTVQAIITVADNGFIEDAGYNETVSLMNKSGITYVSLVAPDTRLLRPQDFGRVFHSHKKAVCDRLGENGKVVMRSVGGKEMDPVSLTVAIIQNAIKNKAAEAAARSGAIVKYEPVSLANHLRNLGQLEQADKIIEGNRLLTR